MEWISKQDNLCYGTRLDRIKSSKVGGRDDRFRNSCEKKLMRIIVRCKDVGMSKSGVKDMTSKIVDGVFGEE